MPAHALFSGLPAFSLPGAAPAGAETRSRIDLHGAWERHVGNGLYDIIPVPSSQRPLGYYHLKRKFLLPKLGPGRRAFLHFDSIHYHGRASLNGREVGVMGPYVPYEFEITQHVREDSNDVDVAIADLIPEPGGAGQEEIALGLNPGWEGSGGIVRDVYVELRPDAFVDNVRLGYSLAPDYSNASCTARMFLSSTAAVAGRAEIKLFHGESLVAQAAKDVQLGPGLTEATLTFDVRAPLLWSPGRPALYRLVATVRTAAGEDEWRCHTGFRDVRIKGRAFLLNGDRLVLAGVCRHDMWKGQGFTLTREQMTQDMRMIKMMGANFVRLAHYPHHRQIIDLAEELGLLVTEEPGHWNVDFKSLPRARIDASLTIMERAIRRDWNSPSVFAWLLGNECTVTVDYLREGKALCNRLDPIARPVSFAHIYGDAKKIYDDAGLDFYSRHMYDFSEEKFRKAADDFGADKPLVHTEWGWEDPARGQIVYERSFDRLMDMIDEGKLAGHSFWSWQDVREYSRIDWPTRDGILMSGVVDEAREPRERLYVELSRLFQMRRHEEPPARSRPDSVPLRSVAWSPKSRFDVIGLQAIADAERSQRAWADLEARIAKFWDSSWMTRNQWKRTGEKFLLWRGADVVIGGVQFSIPQAGGYVRPLVLTEAFPELTIPVGLDCTQLHILGHVTFPAGFPVSGKPGETVAAYSVRSGAKTREVPLRYGFEVVCANLIHDATRIDPIASAAPRALTFIKDVVREQYQVLLYSLPVPSGKIDSLQVRLMPGAEPLAIFAVTAEGVRREKA